MPNIFDNFANGNRGTAMAGARAYHATLIDEFGVPMTDDTASNGTTGTFWEELEQELTMRNCPVDRTEPNNEMQGVGQTMSKEEKRSRLRTIQEELLFTLASRFNGYTNLDDIKRDFQADSGYIPDRVAQEYGYQKFEDFFASDLVKVVYKLVICDRQPTYVPRDCSKFKHIRDEQMISSDTIVRKEDEMEMEKLARALLPENAEQYINGKKTILKILHDLGGETKEVLWMRIQEQYKRETDRELAGEELRKMFQRDKALKILSKFFKNEVDVWDANAPGVFYLRLKKPYNEIMHDFDEMICNQKEAVKKFRANKRQQPPGSGGNPRTKLTMEQKFRPVNSLFAPSIDQSVFLEQSTSQNVTKPSPPTTNSAAVPPTSFNDQIGRESLPQNSSSDKNCVSSSKSKFHIPTDVKGPNANGTAWNIASAELAAEKNAQSKGTRIDWDGQSLAHYEGGDGLQQTHKQPTNANGKRKEDSKKKYTSRNMGTYTDSEEEADNEEEEDARSDVTMVGQTGRRDAQSGTEQQQQQKDKDVDSRRRAAFDDEPQDTLNVGNRSNSAKSAGVHQKNIQKFMREMMEQKGGQTTAAQRTNPSSIVHHPNEPSAVTCSRQKFNLSTDSETAFPAASAQHNRVTHANDDHSNAQTDSRNVPYYETHPNSGHLRTHDEVHPSHDQSHPRSGSVFSACSRPDADSTKVFQLMEHVEELRKIANEKGFSHETRYDEGSFTFRRGDKLLIFTEFDEEKVRGSVHCAGRICHDRYFPKVDWDFFFSAILGLLSLNFGG